MTVDLQDPLDQTQKQRALALTLARDAVVRTGSSNLFSKAASSQVSLAGLLSSAHFIISGERDYVTTDGEYIEWHALAPRRPQPELEAERDGGESKKQWAAWQSGVEDVIEWLRANVSKDAEIEMQGDGRHLMRGYLIDEIRDHFDLPTNDRPTGETDGH